MDGRRGAEQSREFFLSSEAGTGTDPQQGAALARAMLEALPSHNESILWDGR